MAAERDHVGGRVKRYARVGASVGGIAAKLAGSRLFGTRVDHAAQAADLTRALGGLKGPLMKVAQILSTIPDALPRDYAQALTALQADAPAMGWMFVKRRMAAELGPDWQARFAEFGRSAAAAASLGQVHRARLPDGSAVACKLQYPDMASVVEADLAQLKLIFSLYRHYDAAIDTAHIHAELAERLREEVDYLREARHMQLYRQMLADEPRVHVPDPVLPLCTARLLTMSWLTGRRLADFAADGSGSDQAARNQVAYNMFRAWYVPFYYFGVIHGDPHLGNYSLRDDLSVNLLDFGCIRIFPPSFVAGVITLYEALRDGDEAKAVAAYEGWGFRDLNREKIEVLNIWARFVYGPLMEDRSRRMDETNSVAYGARVAEKVHRELRRIGGVAPPREFVLVDRAAIGLGSVFLRLDAKINWHRLFHDLIDDFNVDLLARRQAEVLAAAGLERPAPGK